MKTIFVKDLFKGTYNKISIWRKTDWKKAVSAMLFLCAMFFVGREVAVTVEGAKEASGTALSSGVVHQEAENWGLGFGKEGEKPVGNASVAEMQQYNAYYMAEGEEKVLYLTFDCGYENGNTEPILDALKKHNAPATFFVVGHFLETAPEIAQRMVEEGHTVGNHTYHHPDMSKISDPASFQKEMDDVAALFQETTGSELAMYYRPPQGKYNTANLQMAKELGYTTFFWSLAYVDWDQNKQPSHQEAIDKLTARVHPGAIVLLHSTSQTNGEIMDEILTKWEEMGYTFRPLSDFLEKQETMSIYRADQP
ncbi:MAG: polysaccharide deacetylase family protein [Lachnospiraceae bacterium]|nr:polysaccharide deacetylase family protein [Lachnospiraceae bacterium]